MNRHIDLHARGSEALVVLYQMGLTSSLSLVMHSRVGVEDVMAVRTAAPLSKTACISSNRLPHTACPSWSVSKGNFGTRARCVSLLHLQFDPRALISGA